MCNQACIDFGRANLKEEDVRGKSVIEVGALDVNGSLRSAIEKFVPASYIGVDIQSGRGVDRICKVEDLISTFGSESFDMVVCTELLEHVKDWRVAIHNLKQILRPRGKLLITTRSFGFGYHGYPYDFWRYEVSDMQSIFADFEIDSIEKDLPAEPGVFISARKPAVFDEADISRNRLYSVVLKKRSSVEANSLYWSFVFLPLCKLLGKRRCTNILKR